MLKKQSINQRNQLEIKSAIEKFQRQAEKQLQGYLDKPHHWLVEKVIKIKIQKAPRLAILHESISILRKCLPQKNAITKLFSNQSQINELLFQCQNIIDMAYILKEHLQLTSHHKRVQYSTSLMQTIDNKLVYFFEKQKGKSFELLKVNKIFNFIDFKQTSPNQVYEQISQLQLKYLREQVQLMFSYLIKPWLEKRTPSQYYEDLTPIVYWNVIILDDTLEKQTLLVNLSDKINSFICNTKSQHCLFNYFKTYSYLMDILAINYRKQDPFKIYGLAPLLNLIQSQNHTQKINNWLQNKGKTLKPQQIQNIFRNTFHTGSNIFMFNLIIDFSKTLKQRKQYNVLYHLYLSYIKKQYLDIILPNSTFLKNYMEILEIYVIGFINKDRLDGETQLDKLSTNLSSCLLRRKFTFLNQHQIVIMFYKIYQARFSYLSSISKKFVADLQRKYKYTPQLSEIHHKIHQGAFRDAGSYQEQNTGYQKLNIKRTDRYRGLMNMGNTCYMNSFMQALFMTKKFRSSILDIRDQKNLPSSKTLFYALINLFTEMSTKKIGEDTEITPDVFKNETPQPFKSSWDQHDVGQFGRMYFQSLTNQLDDDQNKSRIQKIFFNKIHKTLTCSKCKNQKTNTQLVFDLILHFSKQDQKIQISKMLKNYFQGEQMSDQNQVYCERCNKKTNSLAAPHPVRLAEYLIITIGLFEYSGGGKKVKKPFNFEFTINFNKILSKQNIPDQNYELYAFIVHIGNQAERGHYICYARNLQQNPTIWYCFDDGYVTERQIQKVSDFMFGESQTPYLLFYSTNKKRKSIQVSNIKFSSQIRGK